MSVEVVESKEKVAKIICFWHKSSVIERLDTICGLTHIDRSEVLRLLVDLFLNDVAFQDRVLEGVRNNG